MDGRTSKLLAEGGLGWGGYGIEQGADGRMMAPIIVRGGLANGQGNADTCMMTWLLANRKEPYFTVTVQSASAPFNYSFTPYITSGQSFWVDWGDGSEETFTTASTAEKSHEYSSSGPIPVACLVARG